MTRSCAATAVDRGSRMQFVWRTIRVHGGALLLATLVLVHGSTARADAADAEAANAGPAAESGPASRTDTALEPVMVTARRRSEDAQKVPAAFNVVGGELLDRTYTVNVDQLSELVPALNYTSP